MSGITRKELEDGLSLGELPILALIDASVPGAFMTNRVRRDLTKGIVSYIKMFNPDNKPEEVLSQVNKKTEELASQVVLEKLFLHAANTYNVEHDKAHIVVEMDEELQTEIIPQFVRAMAELGYGFTKL